MQRFCELALLLLQRDASMTTFLTHFHLLSSIKIRVASGCIAHRCAWEKIWLIHLNVQNRFSVSFLRKKEGVKN